MPSAAAYEISNKSQRIVEVMNRETYGKRKRKIEVNEKQRENSCLKHEIVTNISNLVVRFGSQSLSETTKIHDFPLPLPLLL